ncbi:type 4a pilus biogenesis protein PilO [uncultured Piscinibacter sp.]|uniref:type 4a pilus biogenesis protein PilO n=1 Tax=uncultured Piscinibacter sp. TaxID=1131835 RepID=UPI0026228DF4|nr:type 4a pilus biogenesis protein PilO [uncultured Piscinibacter sp.]
MAVKRGMNVDLNSVFEGAASQFRGLNPNEPGQWPVLPKLMTWGGLALVMVVLGWFFLLSDAHDGLEAERNKEASLKSDYRNKLAQAVNLGELRKQKLQVEEYVTQLEKQLPGKAEMDALLSDINQAGIGRGLQFELFRPGNVIIRDYYAELPIAIKVSGRYHDIGAFAADIANLSRIVTLHNLNIAAASKTSDGALGMDATARTYRYLDPAEIETMKAEKAKAAKGARPGAAGAKK